MKVTHSIIKTETLDRSVPATIEVIYFTEYLLYNPPSEFLQADYCNPVEAGEYILTVAFSTL